MKRLKILITITILSCLVVLTYYYKVSNWGISVYNKKNEGIILDQCEADTRNMIIDDKNYKENESPLSFQVNDYYQEIKKKINNSGSALIMKSISFDSPIYYLSDDNLDNLISVLNSCDVHEEDTSEYDINYYVLFRDLDDKPSCLIEIGSGYLNLNQSNSYKIEDDKALYKCISDVTNTCETINVISPEDALEALASEFGKKIENEDYSYNGNTLAFVNSNGYSTNNDGEEYFYQNIIYYEDMYFDKDATVYAFASVRVIHYDDGRTEQSDYHQFAYYDYIKGTRFLQNK